MVVIFVPGLAVAYLLSRKDFPGKHVVSALVTLPLVLPPTAVGYLLLTVFAERGLLGPETLGFDFSILLTWKAVVVACSVMAFQYSFVRLNSHLANWIRDWKTWARLSG